MVTKGERWGVGINQELGVNIRILLYITDKQQGPSIEHKEVYSTLSKSTWEKIRKKKRYVYGVGQNVRSLFSGRSVPHCFTVSTSHRLSQSVLKREHFHYISVENGTQKYSQEGFFHLTYVEPKHQSNSHNQVGTNDFQRWIWIF